MFKITFFFLFMMLGLLLCRCSMDGSPKDDNMNQKLISIYNHVWELESFKNSNDSLILIPDSNWDYTLTFKNDETVSVVEACNKGEGIFSIQGKDSIQIKVSCTEMACSDPPPNYLGYCDDLNHATKFELMNNKLYIYFTNRAQEELAMIHN